MDIFLMFYIILGYGGQLYCHGKRCQNKIKLNCKGFGGKQHVGLIINLLFFKIETVVILTLSISLLFLSVCLCLSSPRHGR